MGKRKSIEASVAGAKRTRGKGIRDAVREITHVLLGLQVKTKRHSHVKCLEHIRYIVNI